MSMIIIKRAARRELVLIAFFCLSACRADERNYANPYSENPAAAPSAPQSETIRVAFENLPEMRDDSVNIDIGVTSNNGAVEYMYALLSGDAAREGSSACSHATYSEFVPLTQTIKRDGLPAGHHLLCAKGRSGRGATQQVPSVFAWLIDTGTDDEGEETEPTAEDG